MFFPMYHEQKSLLAYADLFEGSKASEIHGISQRRLSDSCECPFLSTRSSESEGLVSKSVLLIVHKELPAQPGGVVEGEDDRDRGWHQQYVVGNWV